MAILVKSGAEFTYAPAGFRILEALRLASKAMKTDFTITSGSDGVHSGPKDPHKTGEAYDIRTHDLTDAKKQELLMRLLAELPANHFYTFLEAPGTANEHIHSQRKNGTTFSMLEYLS